MTGAGFAQALVLGGLVQPQATRKQVQLQARRAGLQVSVQGLDQRFNERAVGFMQQLLAAALREMVQAESQAQLLPQFKGVYVTDCTRLVWQAVGIKLAVRWEIQRGQLQACVHELALHDQKTALVEQPMPGGALHLGDLGFFKLRRFQQWSRQGVFWLTRYKQGTRLYTLAGEPLDLPLLLSSNERVQMPVRVGSGRHSTVAHLLAAPLPEDALIKRLARLTEQARLDQRPVSQRQRALAPWTLYLTNIPDLSFEQAHILARTRWQIELLFKLWKSHGHILRSRSLDPQRQLCEGLAKLIGVMIAHWSLLVAGWHPHRLSMLDALRILRAHVPLLQRALVGTASFAEFFRRLRFDLSLAPPFAKRSKTPLAFQLWYQFDLASFP